MIPVKVLITKSDGYLRPLSTQALNGQRSAASSATMDLERVTGKLDFHCILKWSTIDPGTLRGNYGFCYGHDNFEILVIIDFWEIRVKTYCRDRTRWL
jgi:hypothetical protein